MGSDCAPRRSPPQGVLVVEETSNLLLALAHAAWLGQAFAHCSLMAQPLYRLPPARTIRGPAPLS